MRRLRFLFHFARAFAHGLAQVFEKGEGQVEGGLGEGLGAAGEERAGGEGEVYQSGVFDTGKYGRKYGKSPISKDFRGFLASSEVLISVGLIRLSVYAIPETENATRLFGLSCSDMGLSCISMFAHHASLKGYAIMLQILLMLNAL